MISLVQNENIFEASSGILDLGCGSGDFLEKIHDIYPQKKLCGFDLSSAFVDTFNEKFSQIDFSNLMMKFGIIDEPIKFDENFDSALSVLTLDRLFNPKTLIKNMAQLAGNKVLGVLLPNNPIDDNPSRKQKSIIYTPLENRILPGKTKKEDIKKLQELLEKEWQEDINVQDIKYSVTSSGDKQDYDLSVFYTK